MERYYIALRRWCKLSGRGETEGVCPGALDVLLETQSSLSSPKIT